ncbi:MAG TPA: type IV pilus biogenesis/stability protein PilW [Gammaproteobacteria bacterium]
MTVGSTSRTMLVLSVLGALLSGCAGVGGRASSDSAAAQANLNLGVAYLRQNRPDLAVDNLERAVRLDPRLAAAHNALAVAYDELGQSDEAERHYERAIRLEPANPNIANAYAVALCRRSRWEQAEPYFRRAISNPRYETPAEAATNAGHCARGVGDLERAEQYYREALGIDPANANALAAMMALSYERENYLQARAFLQRYLDVQPATPSVLLLCYNIERELEDRAAAERCARRLRTEFPQAEELAQLQPFERDAQ